jgi:hypothetical protein
MWPNRVPYSSEKIWSSSFPHSVTEAAECVSLQLYTPLISHCFQMSDWLYVPAHIWSRKELMVPTGKETACATESVWKLLQIEHRSPDRPFLSLAVIRTKNSDLLIKEVWGVVSVLLLELLYLIQNMSPSDCAVTFQPQSFLVLNHRVFISFYVQSTIILVGTEDRLGYSRFGQVHAEKIVAFLCTHYIKCDL